MKRRFVIERLRVDAEYGADEAACNMRAEQGPILCERHRCPAAVAITLKEIIICPMRRDFQRHGAAGRGEDRVEAMRLADAFRAQVIDASIEHFTFEITGRVSKIEQFIAIMEPLGLVEVCRTGVAAMNRGKEGM